MQHFYCMSVRTDTINLNVNINGNVAQNQLIDLRKKAQDITLEMKNLKKGSDDYVAASQQLSQVKAQMDGLKQSIGITALSQKELTQELRNLNALKGSVQPFTKEFNDLQTQIDAVQSRLFDVKNGVTGFSSVLLKLGDQVQHFALITAAYFGARSVIEGIKSIITQASKLSDQLADIQRVAGLTADEAVTLNKKLQGIDTRTAVSGLLDIAVIAGKLGVAKDDIFSFTKAVDQLVVSLGDELGNADEITTQLGKILNVFDGKITGDNITHLGNALVELANNGVATGAFMVDFTQRLSGLAKASNLSLASVIGLGAGLEENGARVQASATAVQRLIVSIGADLPKAAKVAGENLKTFTEQFASAPQEALLAYAAGLQKDKASFAEIASAFKDEGETGARVVSTLSLLGQKTDYFKQKIAEAGEALKNTNSISNAFALKNTTIAAELDKIGKSFYSFVSSNAVTNFLKGALQNTLDFIGVLKNLPKTISDNMGAFVTLVAGIAIYNAALIKSAVVTTALRIETIANAVANKAAAIATAIVETAQASYIIVTDLLTGRIKLATAAQRLWNVASTLGAGTIGLIIVAGVALVEILSKIFQNNSKIAIQMKAQADLANKAADSYGDQVNKLEILKSALEDNNTSLETKKKAYQELIALNPDFVKTLQLDINGHLQGAYAVDEYIKSLKRKAEAEAAQQLSNEKNIQILQLQQEKYQRSLQGDATILGGKGSVAFQFDISKIDAKIKALQVAKDFFDKKIIDALGGSGTNQFTLPTDTAGAAPKEDPSVAARRKELEKMIADSKTAYETLNATDKAGQQANLALRAKYQKELDDLDNKKPKDNAEYKRLLKEAQEFYKQLQKLKEDADAASKSQDEKDLLALEQKFNDLHAKALEYFQKNVTSRKKYTEEEKLIVDAFNKDLAALQKKQFDAHSSEEYAQALKASDEYFATQKRQYAESEAEGKISKSDYEKALTNIEGLEINNRLIIANDYSTTVKKAAADVKTYTIQQEDFITKNLEKQKELRIAFIQDEAKATKGIRDIQINDPNTSPKTRATLQKQNATDDKNNSLDVLKQKLKDAGLAYDDASVNATEQGKEIWLKYTEALKAADDDLKKHRIDNQQFFADEALSIAGNLITALDNLDQRALQKDVAINTAKKNNYQKQLDSKLISQKQYDKKVAEADAILAKQQHDADVKAFKRKQALGIAEALINGAIAIEKTFAEFGWPAGVPFAIAMGVATLAQVAAIATEAPPAAEGNWFRTGDKHSDPSGGIPVMIERDEAVIKADTMTDRNNYTVTGTPSQITSKLNSMHGGVNWETGAQISLPKFMQRPAQINPNMPRIMALGGLGSNRQAAVTNQNDELFMRMIAKQDELITEVKNQKDRLHAVVSIKEYRDKEKQYDNARKASGMSQ